MASRSSARSPTCSSTRPANDTAAEFVREKLHEIVRDPDTARKLTPDTVVGCKRLCVDTGYWDTFNKPHVHLVDLRESPIEAITPTGHPDDRRATTTSTC